MLDKMLTQISSSKRKVKEMQAAVKAAEESLDTAEMSLAMTLFGLAEQTTDMEIVERERDLVRRADWAQVEDCRHYAWNGDVDFVRYRKRKTDVMTAGIPAIWFWSGDLVAFYFSNTKCWSIFSKSNVISLENEHGTEEEKRNLH